MVRVLGLPPYAPQLNPVEAVWSHLKRSLANLTKHGIYQLTALIKTLLKRMQYRTGLIDGYLAKTGLGLTAPRPPPLMISIQVATGTENITQNFELSSPSTRRYAMLSGNNSTRRINYDEINPNMEPTLGAYLWSQQ